MLILAFESSAKAASAALLRDGRLVSQYSQNNGLTHSRTLLPMAEDLLKNTELTIGDVDLFAVAHGPGSFTGIRIGVSAVKGLSFPHDTPCYGVSTLEALAYCADTEDCIICPVMDARCRQVYTALFQKEDGGIVRLTEDQPLPLEELAALLETYGGPVMMLGDGADLACAFLSQKKSDVRKFSEIFRFQHASGVAMAAWNMYNNGIAPCGGADLQPVYLRLSQAERELKKKNAAKEEKESTT